MTPPDRAAARRALLEQRLRAAREQVAETTIPPRPPNAPVFASYGQRSLWYLQQLQPTSVAYNMVNAVHIRGALNIDALHAALRTIFARHEVLRTTFALESGEVIQRIHEAVELPFAIVTAAPEAVESQIRTLAHQPFNLTQDLLTRVTLLCTAPDEAVLVIVQHHIISDKWSLEVLFWRELSACYAALLRGETPDLPLAPRQFADYAHWQRAQVTSPAYADHLRYWRDQLADAPALLNLPTDHPRPTGQRFRGKVLYHPLSPTLSQKLTTLTRELGVTLFITLLAAYHVLLHRFSGQDDILIGTTVDMRSTPEIENALGYFLNTLVLREQLDPSISFNTLVERVRIHVLEAFAHRVVEFDQLVEALNPKRDGSYNPIFQTMFVLWDSRIHTPSLEGLTLEPYKIDPDIAKFDLTLYAQTNADHILLAVEYDSDLFEHETAQRILTHYETLLESIVRAPETPITQLNLLPADAHTRLLKTWTAPALDYPRDARIHDLIARQPADAAAVLFGDQALTYGELNRRANQLAHLLIARGVTPETPVGLCVERSPEMVIGILGILKAGSAYVPLDPAYPAARLAYVLADSGIALIVTQERLQTDFPTGASIIMLDGDHEFAAQPHHEPETSVTADDLAYIIYTSGSTGQPKGVRVSHRNLVYSTLARFEVYPEPVQRFLLLSSFAFDSSMVGIFWTLCSGGALCLPPHGAERDVITTVRLIDKHHVTHMLMVPSMYHVLLDYAQPAQLESLTTVIVAGEACPQPLIAKHYRALHHTRLYNEYGPTECTVWATVAHIQPTDERALIGRAIPGTQVYILDDQRQLVPVGVIGELYIGGEGVTQGYHHQPELTAERFIDNPYGAGHLYRTGDLVRYTNTGELDFIGRVDQQVKISGFRIELDEVEQALAQHPNVQNGVAAALPLPSGDYRLVAYVSRTQPINPDSLHDFLAERLPRYMIPSVIVQLEAFPTTATGKIDRARLPLPEQAAARVITTQPRNPVEQEIAAFVRDLLDLDAVSMEDDFFALGGTSLMAARLMAEIERRFSVLLPLAELFRSPTIAHLARLVETDAPLSWSSLVPIRPHGSRLPLFCIHGVKGNLLPFRELLPHIDASIPIYGLQAAGLNGSDAPHTTIEAMAAHYITEIRQVQPHGPYALIGHSAGASIAYEMAQQLQQRGESVRLLGLLDAMPQMQVGITLESVRTSAEFRIRRLLYPASQITNRSTRRKYIFKQMTKAQRAVRREVRRVLRWYRRRAVVSAPVVNLVDRRYSSNDIRVYTLRALARYQPQPYSGKLLYFNARNPGILRSNPIPMLEKLAPHTYEVVPIPGSHLTILAPPHVKELAQTLNERLLNDTTEQE